MFFKYCTIFIETILKFLISGNSRPQETARRPRRIFLAGQIVNRLAPDRSSWSRAPPFSSSSTNRKTLTPTTASTQFKSETFDAVVGVSVWEFVDELETAALETKRIMKPGASLFTICPARNILLDSVVSLWSRIPANEEFKNGLDEIGTVLEKHFVVEKNYRFPRVIGRLFPLYHYYEFRKK